MCKDCFVKNKYPNIQHNNIDIGSVIGEYTVLVNPYKNIGSNELVVDCKCSCGTVVPVNKHNLRQVGKIKHYACDPCVQKLKDPMGYRDPSTYHITHGETKTPLYAVWSKMRSRVANPTGKNECYKGLTIDPKWDVYVVFRDWALGSGYVSGLSIDRKNTMEGYNEDNCRWVDLVTQAQNKKKTKRSTTGIKGVYKLKLSDPIYKNSKQKPYYTIIIYNGKRTTLSGFRTAEEAFEARVEFIEKNYKGKMYLYENTDGNLHKPITP